MENTPYTLPERCPSHIKTHVIINGNPSSYVYLGDVDEDLVKAIIDNLVPMGCNLLHQDFSTGFWTMFYPDTTNVMPAPPLPPRLFLLSVSDVNRSDIRIVAYPILEKIISAHNDRCAGPSDSIPNYEF